ncbi:MAG: Mll4235 protein, partial [uncultured Acetobacteraceae bacterium]
CRQLSPPAGCSASAARRCAARSATAACARTSGKATGPRPSATCRCGACSTAPTAWPPRLAASRWSRSRPTTAGATTRRIAITTEPCACRTRPGTSGCGARTPCTTSSASSAGTTRRWSAGAAARSFCIWPGRTTRPRKAAWRSRKRTCAPCSRRASSAFWWRRGP